MTHTEKTLQALQTVCLFHSVLISLIFNSDMGVFLPFFFFLIFMLNLKATSDTIKHAT